MTLFKTLDVHGINKTLANKQILKDITFNCEVGKITGFIGPNGSGKSSLFKVISGLWNVDSGDIKIDGVDFMNNKEKFISNIGSFIEIPNIYEDLSAKQNFEIILKLHDIKDLSWYNSLISKFDVNSFINKKVKRYSLGMKQKVGIIMALLSNPNIIILDEPTNSLDVTSVRMLHDTLLSIKNDKIILISSHILEELESISDKVFLINNGIIRDSYCESLSNYYIIEFNNCLEKDIKFSSINKLENINETTIKVICDNLDEFFKECAKLNLSIRLIKNESNIKKFFNESIGE